MLYQLVYFSKSIRLLDQNELLNLLTGARKFNQSQGLTGMLLYKDQSFLQLLEGPKQSVLSLFEKIKQDKRHFRIRTLIEQDADQRLFSEWAMGFQNLNLPHKQALMGYSEFMSPEYDIEHLKPSPQQAIRFLLYFRANS